MLSVLPKFHREWMLFCSEYLKKWMVGGWEEMSFLHINTNNKCRRNDGITKSLLCCH